MADFNSTGPSTLQRRRSIVNEPTSRCRGSGDDAPLRRHRMRRRVACRNGIERLVGERAQYCTLLATSLTCPYVLCVFQADGSISVRKRRAPSKYVKGSLRTECVRCAIDIFPSDPHLPGSVVATAATTTRAVMVEGKQNPSRSPHLRKRTPIFRLKSRLSTKKLCRQVRHPPISESAEKQRPNPSNMNKRKRSSRWYEGVSASLFLFFSLAIFY
jgi:hypothetical protein